MSTIFNLPMYCRVCDKITGHDVLGWNVKCQKCEKEHRAPVIRWVALIFILLALFLLPVIILLGVFGMI